MSARKLGSLAGAVALALTTIACAESDPGITTAVKSRLAVDDTVKAYRIDVDTKDRVVTLNGAVDSPVARDRAVELARNTDGVRDVVDQLTVTPGVTPTTGVDDRIQDQGKDAARETGAKTDEAQKKAGDAADRAGDVIADAALTSAVKTKFLADTTISGLRIDVDSKNGVVTLTGTVRSADEKNRALKIARETDGVKSVVDRLKVGR
jgi:hyperosmotically inducible protein